LIQKTRRDVRVVEGARLESVCRGNSTVGSNPTLSASYFLRFYSAFSQNIKEHDSRTHGGFNALKC
jgi:hypothetical protein